VSPTCAPDLSAKPRARPGAGDAAGIAGRYPMDGVRSCARGAVSSVCVCARVEWTVDGFGRFLFLAGELRGAAALPRGTVPPPRHPCASALPLDLRHNNFSLQQK